MGPDTFSVVERSLPTMISGPNPWVMGLRRYAENLGG
jgi:hypothetical protein